MVNKVLAFAAAACSLTSTVLSAPATSSSWNSWSERSGASQYPACTDANMQVRKDFDTMAPAERKAYTDAINCMRVQPSNLDQTLYPAAINRFFDYAVIHVNKTRVVHLDGFFLTWHRMFLHTFEQDLRKTCGYTGAFPYWNWPATADNLTGSAIFDGSEYSMSGDGAFTNNDPIVLAPGFSLPHGSGGGCIKSGPFQGMSMTMLPISNGYLLNGTAPPMSVYQKQESCLTRDLNTFSATTWCNSTAVLQNAMAPDMATFDTLVNGVIGGASLGVHSGAHFTMGGAASNIFVSAQDPIWYPLHTMLDRLYTSWQARHPDIANSTYGTMTAVNNPPSANVTLDTVVPDFGYFDMGSYTVSELISTTAGPFCYKYDSLI